MAPGASGLGSSAGPSAALAAGSDLIVARTISFDVLWDAGTSLSWALPSGEEVPSCGSSAVRK